VKKYKQFVSESTEHLKESFNTTAAAQKQIEGKLELYKEYTEQLLENKELNKAVASMERSITTQYEMSETVKRYINLWSRSSARRSWDTK
jgi:hypothetical protein